jgi:hypothetical protein
MDVHSGQILEGKHFNQLLAGVQDSLTFAPASRRHWQSFSRHPHCVRERNGGNAVAEGCDEQEGAMETLERTEASDRIRERAYAIWQSEGCPEGCAERHWSAAEQEIGSSASDADLQANGYGQQAAQPSNVQKRRRA